TGTMEHARLCLLCLLGGGVILPGSPEPGPAPEPRRGGSLPGRGPEEPELVEALREVLDEGGTREPPALEKRLSWVPWGGGGWGAALGDPRPPFGGGGGAGLADGAAPQCEPREPWGGRRGARFGKLCSCPRGTWGGLLILKCS
ncbi:CART protein, partial [Prunella himalayana]|nr:CART protein [Prunella himalayana]